MATKKATTPASNGLTHDPHHHWIFSQKPPVTKMPKATYFHWLEMMHRIREFEDRGFEEKLNGNVNGFYHAYNGQEAIACGIWSALRAEDCLVTAYRQHGIALMRGMTSRELMAELFGKITGSQKGKGGSMHFFSRPLNYFGGNGIVGAQIGVGTGIGFAEKYRGTDNLCVAMFGDGAARQGILLESFNIAMTWKLPVIYVCENNGYAMGTSVERTSNVKDLYTLGESFDMPGKAVNGMDPVAVHEAFIEAAKHVRAGNGPMLLEIKTYRFRGHSTSDAAHYRTKEELKMYQEIDPIKNMERKMLAEKMATEAEIEAIKEKIAAEIEEAVEFALASPLPDASELFTDNYSEAGYPFITD